VRSQDNAPYHSIRGAEIPPNLQSIKRKPTAFGYPTLKEPQDKWDTINLEAKNVLSPDVLDGLRCTIQNVWWGQYQAQHVMSLPSRDEPGGYIFAAAYADHNKDMNGRIYADGSLQGRFARKTDLKDKWKRLNRIFDGKFGYGVEGQSTEQGSALSFFTDYEGNGFNCTFKHVYPMGMNSVEYIQRFTDSWIAGFQSSFHQSQAITGYAVKNKNKAASASFVFNPAGGSLIEAHYVSAIGIVPGFRFMVGTDFTIQAGMQGFQSLWGIGYACERPNPDGRGVSVKGRIDSSGKVQCSMEDSTLFGLPFTLSGELDHAEKKYKFGIGIGIQVPPS